MARAFEKIFQPFSQASQETSNTYGGTGLGLSITARLVEALGGTISVDSKLGDWSKFTVNLPMRHEVASDFNELHNLGPNVPPTPALETGHNTTGVDMGYISSRLENATVCLVGPVHRLQQVSNIFHEYKVSFSHFATIAELEVYLSSRSQHEHDTRTFICMIHEDLLVGNDLPNSILAPYASQAILLSFGPKRSLDGVAGHYRSLEHMLPSVLMKDLGDYCQHHHEMSFVKGEMSYSCLSSHDNDTMCSVSSPSTSHLQATKSFSTDETARSRLLADPASESVASTAATNTPSPAPVPVPAPAPSSSSSSPFGHLRILIAEDNLVNQKVLGRTLDRLDVKNVDIVDNGQKAVDSEAAIPYDIVLMDVQMPVMDGVQACKLIRDRHSRHCRDDSNSSANHALAAVVFVTAQVSLSCEAEYFQAGAYDFIPKPCSLNGVRNCLQKYVEAQRLSLSLSMRSLSLKLLELIDDEASQ